MSKNYWGKAYIIRQIFELKGYDNPDDEEYDEERNELSKLTILKLHELKKELKENKHVSMFSMVGGCPHLA
jgi:hypothetical protein